MPDIVREFGTQKYVCQLICIDRRDLKHTSFRGGAKLSGRNINLENVGKVLRTSAKREKESL